MMDADQLRRDIIRPALRAIGLWSESAENLVCGTAAQESRLRYVRQLNGPALGLWQMEPATHDDIWKHYLEYHNELTQKVIEAIGADDDPESERLVWDLRYGAIMCRVHYRRVPHPLPEKEDIWGLARYWKTHYNTYLGKGTIHEFVDNYRLVQ